MARYNTVKYGSGVKYGTAPTTERLLWTFIVDWDGDGAFTGENEAGRMIDLTIRRGRDNVIRNDGTIERYRPGKATIILDNDDGRYNPYNTASPLYPLVRPGKSARLAVKNGSDGDNYALMSGKINDIQPYNRGNRQLVRIDVVDGQEFLAGRTVKIGLQSHVPVSSHRTTGWWVDTILQRAGWPAGWPRSYSALQDYNNGIYQIMPYGWFWLTDAMEAVRQMETAELGTFLHARDGTARFIERDFVYERLIELDQSQVGREINIQQPWETIRNRIEVNVSNYRTKNLDVLNDEEAAIFEIGTDGDGAIEIGGYEAFVTDATFRYYNYAVVPLSYFTTVTFTDDPEGGNSLDFNVQLSALADGATVIVQNKSATPGYLRLFQLTADGILYSRSTSIVSDEDDDSQAIYGSRVLRMDSPWIQDNNDAETIAGLLLAAMKEPLPYPTVTLEARPDLQFGLDLYTDAVNFSSTTLGIARLFRIGKIEHQWARENGQAVITTLKFEPDMSGSLPASIVSEFSDDFSRSTIQPLIWAVQSDGYWSHDLINGEAVLDLNNYSDDAMVCDVADQSIEIDTNTLISVRFKFEVGGYQLVRVAITTVEDEETKTYIISVNSISYGGGGYSTFPAYPGQIYPSLIGKTIASVFVEKSPGTSGVGTFCLDEITVDTLPTWDFDEAGQIVEYDDLVEPWTLSGGWEIADDTARVDLTTELGTMSIDGLDIEVTAETRIFVTHRWSMGQASDDTAVSLEVGLTGSGGVTEYVVIPITVTPEYQAFIHTPPAAQIGNSITSIGLVKWGFYEKTGMFYVDSVDVVRFIYDN